MLTVMMFRYIEETVKLRMIGLVIFEDVNFGGFSKFYFKNFSSKKI